MCNVSRRGRPKPCRIARPMRARINNARNSTPNSPSMRAVSGETEPAHAGSDLADVR